LQVQNANRFNIITDAKKKPKLGGASAAAQ
jgi:hypothetical protein